MNILMAFLDLITISMLLLWVSTAQLKAQNRAFVLQDWSVTF